MELNYEAMVDPTNYRSVRRHLHAASQPITGVLFVASRSLLVELASLLRPTDPRGLAVSKRQIETLFKTGKIWPGIYADIAGEIAGVDLDQPNDDLSVQIIYLPPLYLVYAPEIHPILRDYRNEYHPRHDDHVA